MLSYSKETKGKRARHKMFQVRGEMVKLKLKKHPMQHRGHYIARRKYMSLIS